MKTNRWRDRFSFVFVLFFSLIFSFLSHFSVLETKRKQSKEGVATPSVVVDDAVTIRRRWIETIRQTGCDADWKRVDEFRNARPKLGNNSVIISREINLPRSSTLEIEWMGLHFLFHFVARGREIGEGPDVAWGGDTRKSVATPPAATFWCRRRVDTLVTAVDVIVGVFCRDGSRVLRNCFGFFFAFGLRKKNY